MSIMTKRYALFAGYTYYPDGGWGDFRGMFESAEEAKAFADECSAARKYNQLDWGQIVDLLSAKVVLEGDYGRRGNSQWEWEAPQEPEPARAYVPPTDPAEIKRMEQSAIFVGHLRPGTILDSLPNHARKVPFTAGGIKDGND